MVDVLARGLTLGRVREADRLIRRAADDASALVGLEDAAGRRAARQLRAALLEADADLQRRLARLVAEGGDAPMSAIRAAAMRTQVRASLEAVRARLAGMTRSESMRAIEGSLAVGAELLAKLEPLLGPGLLVIPVLPIRQVAAAASGSLLRVHAESVARYGLATVGEMERTIAAGLAQGLTSHELAVSLAGAAKLEPDVRRVVRGGVVHRVTEGRGLAGVYETTSYRAERIVRTETARAYSVARMEQARADVEAGLDTANKILAMFDNRTAYDSVAVHGQVRRPGDYFVDGAGREYPYPPGRPNDRETLIPWRARWAETPYSSPVPDDEREGRVGARARASIPRAARRAA